VQGRCPGLFQTATVAASRSKRAFADTFAQFTPVIGTLALLQFFREQLFRAGFADCRHCFHLEIFATPSDYQRARALGVDTGSDSNLDYRSAVAGAKAINHQLSALLDHFFKLRTQDSSVVAIKRDMEPTWADGEKVVVELISSKMVPAKTG
jgi:hypothetical protein